MMSRASIGIVLLTLSSVSGREPPPESRFVQQSGSREVTIALLPGKHSKIKPGVKVDVEAMYVTRQCLTAPPLPKAVEVKSISADGASATLIVSRRGEQMLGNARRRCAFYLVLHEAH